MTAIDELLSEPVETASHREENAWVQAIGEKNGMRFVLFGAGTLGRKVMAAMRRESLVPLGIADNDVRKHGSVMEGVQVVSPTEAVGRWGADALFVVTILRPDGEAGMASRLAQLRSLGCRHVIPFLPAAWRFSSALPHFGADLPSRLLAHAGDLRKVAALWSDPASREIFRQQLLWRLRGDFSAVAPPTPDQYFPRDLIAPNLEESFVDGGAFDGDTLRSIPWPFKRAWAFEPDPANIAKLRTMDDPSISIHEMLLGRVSGRARFNAEGTMASARTANGSIEIPVGALDELLADESPTFLKLDVEGDELAALQGARRILKRSRPVVAACVYHRPEDLWTIPLFLHEVLPEHRFFLRSHANDGFELVTYAIPPRRCLNPDTGT